MEKQTVHTNKNLQQSYTVKDSSLMLIIAIFLPYLIYFLFSLLVTIIAKDSPFANEVLFGVTGKYISAFICQFSLIGGAFVLARRKKLNFIKSNNFSFKLDYVKVLIVLVIGFVALFGFNWLSDLISYGLNLAGYNTNTSSLVSYGVNNFGMLLLCILFLAVLPAICEEISMRGVILNGLNRKNKNFAIFISALMFMIIHLSLAQSIYQFVLGVILASIVYYSGNILYSIILHFANNALVLILNYAWPHSITPQYFFSFGDIFLPIFTAIISVIIIYFLIKLFRYRCVKTNCQNLGDKSKDIKIEEQCLDIKNDAIIENTNNKRDLPPVKLEVLSEKTFFIISLSLGIFMWLINVISGFLL